MINFEIIQLLKSLSADELKRFEKFLSSPYLNSNKKLPECLKVLRKYYPDFSGGKLNKAALYGALYPGKSYKDITVKRILWDMGRKFSEFIIQEHMVKNKNLSYNY